MWFEADVTDQDAVNGAVEGTVAALGGIDVVIANAGVANNGTVAISPPEALVKTLEVNLVGVVRTVSAALPHVTQRRGYVCIISSTAAFTMMPGHVGLRRLQGRRGAVRQLPAARGRAQGRARGLRASGLDRHGPRARPAGGPEDLRRGDGASFPYPLNATTSVEDCADAIVDGIERKRSRVYVPKAIGGVQALRTVFTGPIASWIIRRESAKLVPQLEAELTALGRHFGSSSAALTPGAAEAREKLPSS